MTYTVGILGLALLVLVHEAGHFVAALAVGMRPRRFSLGFPPTIARVRRRGIEYAVGAIPLGGYVKIPGMHRPAPSDVDVYFRPALQEAPSLVSRIDRVKRLLAEGDFDGAAAVLPQLAERVTEADLSANARKAAERGVRELGDGLGKDAYWRHAIWRRVAVIFAGPATNLVLAIALFAAVLMQDTYQIGVQLHAGAEGRGTTRVVATVPGSPAAEAGLKGGDRIVAVDGRPVGNRELLDRIQGSEGRPLQLTVDRRGERIQIGPVRARRKEGLALPAALWRGVEITGLVTERIVGFFPRLVTDEGRKEVASPVGIVQGSSEALEESVPQYLFVLGLISLSLALLNLLPLLPLDGGHILFSLLEGVRRRAVAREVYERVSIVGIAVLALLFVIGLSNDLGGRGSR